MLNLSQRERTPVFQRQEIACAGGAMDGAGVECGSCAVSGKGGPIQRGGTAECGRVGTKRRSPKRILRGSRQNSSDVFIFRGGRSHSAVQARANRTVLGAMEGRPAPQESCRRVTLEHGRSLPVSGKRKHQTLARGHEGERRRACETHGSRSGPLQGRGALQETRRQKSA